MKKRRELDALVTGKQGSTSSGGRGTATKNGRHELLRNDTDSSDVEEFSLPEESAARKRSAQCSLCSTCLSVWWAFLLVSCLLAVSGLFVLHFQLKADFDQLKDRFNSLENQKLSSELVKVQTDQEQLQISLKDLIKSDTGTERIIQNISLLISQVSMINSTVRSLSASVVSATQLQTLPQQFNDLSKSVAVVGSSIQTLQGDVQSLLETKTSITQQLKDLDAKILTMQLEEVSKLKTSTTAGPSESKDGLIVQSSDIKQLSTDVIKALDVVNELNVTMRRDVAALQTHSIQLDTMLTELHNYTSLLNTRLTYVELKYSALSHISSHNNSTEEVTEFRNSTMLYIDNAVSLVNGRLDNKVSHLQAMLENTSLSVAQLTTRAQEMSAMINHLDQSTDATLQYLNDTVDRLDSQLKTVRQTVDSSDSSSSVQRSSTLSGHVDSEGHSENTPTVHSSSLLGDEQRLVSSESDAAIINSLERQEKDRHPK